MATSYNSLQASALLWSMASLNGAGGSGGGSGTPGKDGNSWIVVNEPVTDGFSAPLGAKANDLILDSSGEIYRVVNDNGDLLLFSTGVSLMPEVQQKSLYQLYEDLEPTNKLTEVQFKSRFLEALEEHENFDLYQFYKNSGGLKYTTEADFVKQFVKVMDLDLDELLSLSDKIQALDEREQNHYEEVLDLILELAGKFNTLELKVNNKIKEIVDSVTQLEDKHNKDIASLNGVISQFKTDVTNEFNRVDNDIYNLRKAHTQELDELAGQIDKLIQTDNEIKKTVIDLETKHDKDIADLQEQFDSLENSIVTTISIFFQEKLPPMIEEEVKKQLADLDLGDINSNNTCCTLYRLILECDIIDGNLQPGEKTKLDVLDGNYNEGDFSIEINGCCCCCCIPKQIIIDGSTSWEEVKQQILIFWGGLSNTPESEYQYIIKTPNDPAVTVENPRLVWGGDSNPMDDGDNFMSFDEWIKFHGLETIYNGGDAETQQDIENTYYWLFEGGNAFSEY